MATATTNNGNDQRYWKRKTLNICSFNVLCKHYEPNHLPNSQCSFAVRSPILEDRIRRANSDVVYLTECNPVSWYRQKFASSYDILFMNKTFDHNNISSAPGSSVSAFGVSPVSVDTMRSFTNDDDDGAAFMFKKGTVQLISCSIILVRGVASNKNDNTNNPGNNPNLVPGQNRARQFASFAHVLHLASKKTFFICGMHMKADMNGTEFDAERICHLKQVMAAIAQLRTSDPAAPLFFCGDLNCDPSSGTMQMMLKGTAEYNGVPQLLGASPFVSAMKEMSEDGDTEVPFTILDSSYGNGPWSKVLDYILYEKTAKDTGRVIPVACLTPPSLAGYGSDAILKCGSDHIPLVVEFLLL